MNSRRGDAVISLLSPDGFGVGVFVGGTIDDAGDGDDFDGTGFGVDDLGTTFVETEDFGAALLLDAGTADDFVALTAIDEGDTVAASRMAQSKTTRRATLFHILVLWYLVR